MARGGLAGAAVFRDWKPPPGPFVEPLSTSRLEEHYDPDRVAAAYSTIERSVDPGRLADRLGKAVRSAPEVRFRAGCTVSGVSRRTSGALDVEFKREGDSHRESYDCVVNALWSGRLAIDAGLGLLPQRPWIYRYKFGICLRLREGRARPPTLTTVHGAFGDVVDFPSKLVYVSWYPSGMVGTSGAITPPDWESMYGEGRRRQICDESVRALGTFCVALRDLPGSAIETPLYAVAVCDRIDGRG